MSNEKTKTGHVNLIDEWKAWADMPKPKVNLDESREQIFGAVIEQQSKTICDAWACIQDLVNIVNLAAQRVEVLEHTLRRSNKLPNDDLKSSEALKAPESYDAFKHTYRDCIFLTMALEGHLGSIDGNVTEVIYEKAFKDAERFMLPNDGLKGSA